jgi:histone H3/H4
MSNKTLREIKVMQKFTDLLMSRLLFQRVVKKIMKNEKRIKKQHMLNLRIQKKALNALQKTIEEFLIEILKNEFNHNLNSISMRYQYNTFSDQFIDYTRQKNDDTDQEHAIIKLIT